MSRKNPLLIFNKPVISKESFHYKSHSEWNTIESSTCMKVFEKWYEDNNKNDRYNHIRHAFNSICKNYKKLNFIKYEIVLNNELISTLWRIESFNTKNWLYQLIDDNFQFIAYKEEVSIFEIKENDLEPLKYFIEDIFN